MPERRKLAVQIPCFVGMYSYPPGIAATPERSAFTSALYRSKLAIHISNKYEPQPPSRHRSGGGGPSTERAGDQTQMDHPHAPNQSGAGRDCGGDFLLWNASQRETMPPRKPLHILRKNRKRAIKFPVSSPQPRPHWMAPLNKSFISIQALIRCLRRLNRRAVPESNFPLIGFLYQKCGLQPPT